LKANRLKLLQNLKYNLKTVFLQRQPFLCVYELRSPLNRLLVISSLQLWRARYNLPFRSFDSLVCQ